MTDWFLYYFWSSVDCAILWPLDRLINSGTTLWLVVWAINEQTDERTNQRMNEWTNERTNGWMNGWMDWWMDKKWMEKRMNESNERTHGRTNDCRMNEWMIASMNRRQTNAKMLLLWSAPGKKYYQTMVNTLARLFYLRHPSDMMVILVFQSILYHTYRTTLAFLVSSHSENFSLLLVHLKNRGLFHRDTSSML